MHRRLLQTIRLSSQGLVSPSTLSRAVCSVCNRCSGIFSKRSSSNSIHMMMRTLRSKSTSKFASNPITSQSSNFSEDTIISCTDHIINLSKTAKNDENFVVCVEGNIGCGKTTLLNYFENVGNCEVVAEPVNKWRNVKGHNPLAMMYSDPSRWAMALQTYVQLTMLQIHKTPHTHKVRLMERSIFSAKYCFVDNLYKSGVMHEMEYIILTKWFDWIIESHKIKVDLIVYLQTDPILLHERIMKRCRKEEQNIPVEYLQSLHQLHEDWLVHQKIPCPADVLVLDANTSLEQMKTIYEQHKNSILNSQEMVVQSF